MSHITKIKNGYLLAPSIEEHDPDLVVFIKDLPGEVVEALEAHSKAEAEEREYFRERLKVIAQDLNQDVSLPTLDQEVTERLAA